MNKKYFSYLLQTKKTAVIFIFLMYLTICSSEFILNVPNVSTFSNSLWYGFILSVAFTFILPVILFSFIHQRRSRDVFLALPIKRKELLITSLIFAFVCIFGCMFLTFIILYVLQGRQWFDILQFAGVLIYGAFIIITLLIIHTLLFLIANNTFDGIVMIAAYSVMPLLLFLVEDTFYSTIVAGNPYPEASFSTYFSPLAMHYSNYRGVVDQSGFYGISLLYIASTVLITLVALFLLKKEFIERKSERSEQLSDGIFAYPFVINIYAFLLLLNISFTLYDSFNDLSYMLIYYLLIFFAYVIAEFVYHRSITFKLSTVIKYVAAVGISLLIAFIGWKSEGFGLARNYAVPTKGTIQYYYTVLCKDDFSEIAQDTPDSQKIYVDLFFEIPAEKQDAYEDVIQIFEEKREQAIDAYYAGTNDPNAETTYFSISNYLTTYQFTGGYMNDNISNYSYEAVPLSLEELKILDGYAEIHVQDYNYEKEYSLKKYMKLKGLE